MPQDEQDGAGGNQVRRDGGGRFAQGQSGNVRGRSPAAPGIGYAELASKLDGWIGRGTGMGMRGVDKGMDSEFAIEPITDQEARDLYAGDDICKRVVNLPAREMYREGFEITVPDDTDTAAKITNAFNALGGTAALIQAKQYERAYGGAAIFPLLNDQQADLRKPLNRKRIVELTHLHIIEPCELVPITWYHDLAEPKRGRPEIYQYIPISQTGGAGSQYMEIHESRLILWYGEQVTKQLMTGAKMGWGHSVFVLMKSALRGFNVTFQSMSTLVADFAQAVIKMKNLAELVALGKVDEIRARMLMVEYCRSVARAVLIDSEEEYKRETTTVTGLPELADRIASRLAAAANMMLTMMMGQSPKGLGNEGDSDLHWWYNQIAGLQVDDTPMVKQLLELIMLSLDGPTKGKILDGYAINWRALWHPSDKETAETRHITMETDVGYYGIGVLDREDIAGSRFGGEKYGMETTIDWEARAQAEADLAAAQAERDQQMSPGAAPLAGGIPTGGGMGGGTVQATAMNGAQVSSMVEVVRAALAGEIPRESAVAILTVAFPVSVAQAEQMLGPKNFKPTAPPPPANPFGGGGPPNPAPPPPAPPADKPSPEDVPAPPADKQPPKPTGKADAMRADMLREIGGEWFVYNDAGTKRLAGPMTEAEARARLVEIEAAKAAKSKPSGSATGY